MKNTTIEQLPPNSLTEGFFLFSLPQNGAQFKSLETLEDLAHEMGQDVGTGMIIYEAPTAQVARALVAGADPAKSVAAWGKQAKELLKFVRQFRRRLTVVQAPLEPQAVEKLTDLLGQRFPKTTLPELAQFMTTPADFFTSLSAIELNFDSLVVDLLSELEACSLGPSDALPAVDNAVCQILQAWNKRERELEAKHAEEVEAQNREVNELKDKLVQAQDSQASHELKQELLVGQIRELEAAVHTSSAQQDEALGVNRELRAQLEDALSVNSELKAQLEEANTKIDAFYRSTSWRLTTPLRRIKKFFDR